jgi:hypothetical protein
MRSSSIAGVVAQNNPMRRIQTLAITEDGHIWSGSDNGRVIDYPKTKRAREAAKLQGVFQILPDHSGRSGSVH